ncbi:MAG: sulfotransferase domain-containing protein [Thermomicrobiales bacterium]|nr:sulfotransferase domain-containing protein [Thermomicrobiales bacterium]
MKILIVAPPKTGNSWLKCLLSTAYGIEWMTPDQAPPGADFVTFRDWVEAGSFPANGVYHRHYDYSPDLCDLAAHHGIHLATILRDPYDMFVSRYFFTQAQADNERRADKPVERGHDGMTGKPIDDPAVLEYLADGFGAQLQKGIDWLQSGASVVVRYEALHADPVAELTRAANEIEPVAPERITAAIEACQADTLLQRRKGLRRRIRSATVGDWRNHLGPQHLALFRVHHADRIHALGYEVH